MVAKIIIAILIIAAVVLILAVLGMVVVLKTMQELFNEMRGE